MDILGYLFNVMSLVGVIWIAVVAFQNGDIVMGIFSLICGIVAIVYGVQNMDRLKVPLLLIVVGIIGSIVFSFAFAGNAAAI